MLIFSCKQSCFADNKNIIVLFILIYHSTCFCYHNRLSINSSQVLSFRAMIDLNYAGLLSKYVHYTHKVSRNIGSGDLFNVNNTETAVLTPQTQLTLRCSLFSSQPWHLLNYLTCYHHTDNKSTAYVQNLTDNKS